MPAVVDQSLTLVGPGRAGRAFARSWCGAGGRIAQLILRSDPATSAGFPGATLRRIDEERFDPCDILVLGVPDDAIAEVAGRLAGRLPCRVAFHFSGALASSILAPLAVDRACVGSLHPLAPFTGAEGENWNATFVAVEGNAAFSGIGEQIARALGARPYPICAVGKPLYHAAASLAAGGTVAVLSLAVRACVAAGIPEQVAQEALAGLASRASAAALSLPFEEAFTGAVSRRDVGTVRVHLRALGAHPEALALYRAMAREILARTSGRGREAEILDLLREDESPISNPTGSS